MKKFILLTFLMIIIVGATLSAGAGEGYFYEQDFDLEGDTIRFNTWAGNPFEEEAIAAAEKKFNFNFEFHSYSANEYKDVLVSRVISGESKNDIWHTTPDWIIEILAQNLYLPLDEVVPDNIIRENPEDHTTVWEGHIYGMLGGWDTEKAFGRKEIEIPELPSSHVVIYNVDIIEKEGLKDPYELYMDGEWTLENLGKLAEQATMDLTGDGEIDQWGIGATDPRTLLFQYDKFVERDEGKIVFALGDDEIAQNKIESLARWNVEDNSVYGAVWDADYFEGRDMFHDGEALFLITRIGDQFRPDDMIDRFRILPIPDYYRSPTPLSVGQLPYYLPINSQYPEAKIAILDYISNYFTKTEDEMMDEYYSFIDEYSVDDKGAQVLMDWYKLKDVETGDINRAILNWLWRQGLQSELQKIVRGEIGYRAAMDAFKPEIQSMVDDLLEQ